MLRAIVVLGFLLLALLARSADAGSLDASPSDTLWSPTYNTLGETAPTHITTMKPRTVVRPSGPIRSETRGLTPGGVGRGDNRLLLERHLDCFSGAVPPDRDTRNSFLSRCPGNSR